MGLFGFSRVFRCFGYDSPQVTEKQWLLPDKTTAFGHAALRDAADPVCPFPASVAALGGASRKPWSLAVVVYFRPPPHTHGAVARAVRLRTQLRQGICAFARASGTFRHVGRGRELRREWGERRHRADAIEGTLGNSRDDGFVEREDFQGGWSPQIACLRAIRPPTCSPQPASRERTPGLPPPSAGAGLHASPRQASSATDSTTPARRLPPHKTESSATPSGQIAPAAAVHHDRAAAGQEGFCLRTQVQRFSVTEARTSCTHSGGDFPTPPPLPAT